MRSVALNRITRIANELARNKPDGHELVKELFEAQGPAPVGRAQGMQGVGQFRQHGVERGGSGGIAV
jgi:hypothetical protein